MIVICLTADAVFNPSPKEFDNIMIENTVRMNGMFVLKENDIYIDDLLGKGNFSSVMRGTYRLDGKLMDVAAKIAANDVKVSAVLLRPSNDSRDGLYILPLSFVFLFLTIR